MTTPARPDLTGHPEAERIGELIEVAEVYGLHLLDDGLVWMMHVDPDGPAPFFVVTIHADSDPGDSYGEREPDGLAGRGTASRKHHPSGVVARWTTTGKTP